MKLTLPFPPSVNGYWRATNTGMKISASGRSFRSNAIAAILTQLKRRPQPITVNVEVNVLLYPPDRRNRDLDNYQKALFDSLTHAGVWVDDRQIKRFTVEWGDQVKQGKAEVTITPFTSGGEMISNSGYSANTGDMLQMPLVKVGPVHLQVMGRDRLKIMRVKCVESSKC